MINGAEAHRSTALCQPYAYVHIGYVCVYYCSIYYKAVRVGGGGTMEDMCYERLRSEACVDCVGFITAGPGLVCPSRTHRLCIRTYRYFAYVYIGILCFFQCFFVFFNVSCARERPSKRPVKSHSSRCPHSFPRGCSCPPPLVSLIGVWMALARAARTRWRYSAGMARMRPTAGTFLRREHQQAHISPKSQWIVTS